MTGAAGAASLIASRGGTRQTPVFVDVNGVNGTANVSTTCLAGHFLISWDTNATLTPPTLRSGWTGALPGIVSDGSGNDFSGLLSWRVAPSNNYTVVRGYAGKEFVAWYSGVDATAPIVEGQSTFSNTNVTTLTFPALAGFAAPHIVLLFTRLVGTATGDLATIAGITARHTQSEALAEQRMGDTGGVVSGWASTPLTTGNSQHVAAVVALLGALP